MSNINLPSIPRSADRDTTVFLQAVKRAIEEVAIGAGGETNKAVKDYVARIGNTITDDLMGVIDESTSLDAILDLIQGSITESQLSINLGKRIELILTNETAISEEIQTRIAEMLLANERISTEVEQRQSEDAELTRRVDIVLANTNDNRASIVEEVLARTNLTDAHASRLTALDTKTNTSSARIGTLETANSTNIEALATAKTELRAQFAEGDRLNRVAINSESTARSNADTALGSRVDTVQAVSNGNVSSIQTQATVIAGINTKLSATWSVKADVNGVVGGIALGNDGVTVDFLVRANTFAVQGPSGSKSVPFVVYPEGTYLNGEYINPGVYMTDAYIRNAMIDTLKIRGQAVTVTDSAVVYGTKTSANVYINAGGGSVQVRVSVFDLNSGGGRNVVVYIYRNGSVVKTYESGSNNEFSERTGIYETVLTGGYSNDRYHAEFVGSSVTISQITITATSFKR